MNLKPGRRYRINDPSCRVDGRVGVLEVVNSDEAWLMVSGRLVRVPVQNITDRNVVQEDLTHLRVRQPTQLEWSEGEQFA